MMKKIVFLLPILLFLCAVTNVYAQVTLKIKSQASAKESSIKEGQRKESELSGLNGHMKGGEKIKDIKPDRVVLYEKVVKRFGRWEGYGKPITIERASHLQCYYKMTYSGGSKYPVRLQAYNGYHKLTTNHSIGTYLVAPGDEHDSGSDSIWAEKLKTITQWDFIYNEKGDIAIERSYDESGNLVYSYYPVKIGNRTAGTFTDAWGTPAKLRKNGEAEVVYISYDSNGFESLHEFYDELGFRQKNRDEAYMSRMTNTYDGLVTKKASCNIAGELMIDIYGNCGMEAEYDKYGNITYETNMNEKWEPIRLKNGVEPFYYNMIKRKYDYDIYNRVTRMSFVDLQNKPDTNSVGIHSIEYTYNDRGDQTSISYKDLYDNTKVNPYNGFSRIEYVYDNKGNILLLENYGDYKKLSENGYYKRITWDYDCKGKEIEKVFYKIRNDSIYVDSRNTCYIRTQNGLKKIKNSEEKPQSYIEERELYGDNMIVTIEYDNKGRNILWAYSDLEGNPITPDEYGYSKDIEDYIEQNDTIINIERYVDHNGKIIIRPNNGWAIYKSYTYDNEETKKQCKDIYMYDIDSTLYRAYRHYYDEEGNIIAQQCLNRYGKPSRTAKEGVVYYNNNVSYALKGGFSSFVSTNEFNEPSYYYDESSISYYSNFVNGERTDFDENGKIIESVSTFKDSIPAVMVIVVSDSIAYRLGLKDNDVIIKYGQWVSNMRLQDDDVQNSMYVEMIDKATEEKDIMVLRHNPAKNNSDVINIHLPIGSISELGIFPQLVFYTNSEKERYEKALRLYCESNGFTRIPGYSIVEGEHKVIMRIPKKVDGYVPSLGGDAPHIFNPGFVLSLANYKIEGEKIIAHQFWNMDMGIDTLMIALRRNRESDDTYYISVTTDLISSYDGFPYYSNAHSWQVVNVSDKQFTKLRVVFDRFKDNIGESFDSTYLKKETSIDVTHIDRKMTPEKFYKLICEKYESQYALAHAGFLKSIEPNFPSELSESTLLMFNDSQKEVYEDIIDKSQSINLKGYDNLYNEGEQGLAIGKVHDTGISDLLIIGNNDSMTFVLKINNDISSTSLENVKKLFK